MAKSDFPPKKGPNMATAPSGKQKSAEDELLDSFGQLIDEAADRMSHEEFMKTAKKSSEILDRAIAAHSRRRGTA
jgi:hypothetical protein